MPKIFFPSSRPKFIDVDKITEEIKQIALKVAVKNKKIEEIYLFGSYADGNASLHSDADILIILSEDKRRMMDRLDEFILEFVYAPVPVDVLVYTRDEIKKSQDDRNQFLAKAMSGIKLVGNSF